MNNPTKNNAELLATIVKFKQEIRNLEDAIWGAASEAFLLDHVYPAMKNGRLVQVEILEMSDHYPRFRVRNINTDKEYWVELSELLQGAGAEQWKKLPELAQGASR